MGVDVLDYTSLNTEWSGGKIIEICNYFSLEVLMTKVAYLFS